MPRLRRLAFYIMSVTARFRQFSLRLPWMSPVLRQNFLWVENNKLTGSRPSQGSDPSSRDSYACAWVSLASSLIRLTSIYRGWTASFPPHQVGIRRPDRSDGATLPVVGETRTYRKPPREFCQPVFASQGQGACGLRGGSGRIQKATVLDGVH